MAVAGHIFILFLKTKKDKESKRIGSNGFKVVYGCYYARYYIAQTALSVAVICAHKFSVKLTRQVVVLSGVVQGRDSKQILTFQICALLNQVLDSCQVAFTSCQLQGRVAVNVSGVDLSGINVINIFFRNYRNFSVVTKYC